MSAHFSRKKVGCSGWMDGWVGGWMEVKAGLRIAYSNQKLILVVSKNCKICSKVKFEKENVEYVH